MSSKLTRIIVGSLFIAGILLRIILGIINNAANDDHIAVSKFIVNHSRIPELQETWQAYHPKLYHLTIALIIKLLPSQPESVIIRLAQMVNVGAGSMTLVIVQSFLQRLNISKKAQVITFAFAALNPAIIGVNAQASNDSFVILFSTGALYFGYKFFTYGYSIKNYTLMMIATILASLSKGNGLIIFIGITATLLFALWKHSAMLMNRSHIAVILIASTTIFTVSILLLGPYWSHYASYGSPFATNSARKLLPDSWPPFLVGQENSAQRGVTSIIGTFLTFRLVSLLQTPYNAGAPYPRHETSLWSQLYARTQSPYFEPWPPSWKLETNLAYTMNRIVFLAGVLPTLLFLIGIIRGLVYIAKAIFPHSEIYQRELGDTLIKFTALGYLAFITLFVMRYIGLNAMKAIYIFPGLLAFLVLFAVECNHFYQWLTPRRWIRATADTIFIILFLSYVAEISLLINQLR